MSRKSSYKIDFTIVFKHEALSFYFLYQMKKHVYVFDTVVLKIIRTDDSLHISLSIDDCNSFLDI